MESRRSISRRQSVAVHRRGLRVTTRASQSESTEEVEAEGATKEVPISEESGGAVQQLLGIRGGKQETNLWKIRLQLTKPVRTTSKYP